MYALRHTLAQEIYPFTPSIICWRKCHLPRRGRLMHENLPFRVFIRRKVQLRNVRKLQILPAVFRDIRLATGQVFTEQ